MDKWILEDQIRSVVNDSDDWLMVKDVANAIKERYGTESSSPCIRGRLNSMVAFKEIEFKTEDYRGHRANYYRRRVPA